MWLCSLLLWVLVSPRAIYGSDCLVETLKCSRFRPVLHTHKELLTTRTQMNKMCRQQDQFFECLDHMVASKEMDGAIIPSTLQHSRTLINDLCSNTSPWQNLYFDVAACINRQYTEFCVSPEFLRRVVSADKPRSICSLREEAVSCIAATLSLNCGKEAGKLFHHLLRMSNDGSKNCYAIGSETLSFPTLREARCNENLEACKEVFDNFMKRISNIEMQDESVEDLVPIPVQVLDNETASVSEKEDSTSSAREEFPSTPISNGSTKQFGVLDTIAKLNELGIVSYKKSNDSKRPEFLSAFRYHGNSLSMYVKFSAFYTLEFSFCKNDIQDGMKVHICTYVYRENSPVCLEGGRNLNQTGIPINPEDIDPDLGARLYAMFPYAYYFSPYAEMYERMFKHIPEYKNLFDSSNASLQTDIDDSVTATDSATQNGLDLYRSLFEKYTTDSPAVQGLDSTNTVPEDLVYSEVQDEEKDEYYSSSISEEPTAGDLWREYVPFETTKAETMVDVSDAVTPSGTDSGSTTFDSTHLSDEQRLMDMLAEETKWFFTTALKSPPLKVEKPAANVVRLTINGRDNSQLVNVTCARVNECHPNATDVEKCLYYFTLEGKVPTEEASQPRYRSPRKALNGSEININTNGIQSEAEKVSRIMKNIPVIIFDEAHEQPLDFSESKPENTRFGRNREKYEQVASIRKAARVQFYDHETLDSVPFVNSEQSLQEKADDASVDNEYISEEFDLMSDDENLRSGSFGESSREMQSLLKSLKELESRIAEGLKSIRID